MPSCATIFWRWSICWYRRYAATRWHRRSGRVYESTTVAPHTPGSKMENIVTMFIFIVRQCRLCVSEWVRVARVRCGGAMVWQQIILFHFSYTLDERGLRLCFSPWHHYRHHHHRHHCRHHCRHHHANSANARLSTGSGGGAARYLADFARPLVRFTAVAATMLAVIADWEQRSRARAKGGRKIASATQKQKCWAGVRFVNQL